jgi:hypothetical protein
VETTVIQNYEPMTAEYSIYRKNSVGQSVTRFNILDKGANESKNAADIGLSILQFSWEIITEKWSSVSGEWWP